MPEYGSDRLAAHMRAALPKASFWGSGARGVRLSPDALVTACEPKKAVKN